MRTSLLQGAFVAAVSLLVIREDLTSKVFHRRKLNFGYVVACYSGSLTVLLFCFQKSKKKRQRSVSVVLSKEQITCPKRSEGKA